MADVNVSSGAGITRDAHATMQYDANKKSAVIAYLLWFFLGGLGIHRFYLGSTGPAIAMLVITIVSFVLLFVVIGIVGLIAVGIWLLVDAFLIPGMTQDYNSRLVAQISGAPAAGRIVLQR